MRSMTIVLVLVWLGVFPAPRGHAAEDAGGTESKRNVRLPDKMKLWEPWVDSALVGDMVVRNYSGFGYREHREVISIDADAVTVVVRRSYHQAMFADRSDEIWRLIYSRRKYPALEQFYASSYKIIKGDPLMAVAVKGEKVNSTHMRGRIITAHRIDGDKITISDSLRCRMWVRDDIPFGGLAKRIRQAPLPNGRDGKKKSGPFKFEFVIDDFARGKGTRLARWDELLQTAEMAAPATVTRTRGERKPRALPAQTVGWRGDGTGRFSDATPPMKWGRISATMKGLRVQASRPKGDGPGDAGPVLHGTIRDWLVLYPVPFEGSTRELADKDLLADETKIQPDVGEKAGELEWKLVSVEGSGLYFNRILPNAKNLKGQAIYVHTYIYSPRPCYVFMWIRGVDSTRFLLNGEPLVKKGRRNVWRAQLREGWNRFLARVLPTAKGGGSSPDTWSEGAASFQLEMYGGEADETYEETGILWTVEPPQAGQPSYYQPIVVGDRIYVTSSPAFLICYDKRSGKRLWLRDNGFYEFITAEERRASPELFAQIDPKVKRFRELAESFDGSLAQRHELGELYRDWAKLLRKVDRVKYAYPRGRQEPGLASQPVSDGKSIYTWSHLGIAACYDLDGNRKWMTLENEGIQVKHGYESAPMLVGRDMVVSMRNIIGFDRESGRINWKVLGSGSVYSRDGKPRHGDQTDLVNYAGLGVYKPGLGFFPWSHTTREGNMLYRIDHDGVVGRRSTLPDPLTEAPTLKESGYWNYTWFEPADDRIIIPGVYRRASLVQGNALFHDGLIYTISTGGVLRVEESERDKHLYSRLVGLNPLRSGLTPAGAGNCASPTLAGKYVYLFGADGTTLVIKAGRKYEPVAMNRIERLLPPVKLAWGRPRSAEEMVMGHLPEITISSPVFDGNRLYYRAERFLYCIGGQR